MEKLKVQPEKGEEAADDPLPCISTQGDSLVYEGIPAHFSHIFRNFGK